MRFKNNNQVLANQTIVFYKLLMLIFVLQFSNIQAQIPMKIPPSLQKGDTIAILSTARKNN